MKKITCLLVLLCASFGYAQSFIENFDDDSGINTTFTKMLEGVSFTFTFSGDGDGGDFAWEDRYGLDDSPSINILSGGLDVGTTERVTISRTDGAEFIFNSIYINSTSAATISVGGYVADVLVGSVQTVETGMASMLTFGGIQVDEVRLSSNDFYNINMDAFAGNLSTLGIKNYVLALSKVVVSPNPVSDVLQISSHIDVDMVRVYDVTGKEVLTSDYANVVDVSHLTMGIYFIKVFTNGGTYYKKIIKN